MAFHFYENNLLSYPFYVFHIFCTGHVTSLKQDLKDLSVGYKTLSSFFIDVTHMTV